jgi:hypothetical protein
VEINAEQKIRPINKQRIRVVFIIITESLIYSISFNKASIPYRKGRINIMFMVLCYINNNKLAAITAIPPIKPPIAI